MPVRVATFADTCSAPAKGVFTGGPCASYRIQGSPVAIVGSQFTCNGGDSIHTDPVETSVLTGRQSTLICSTPVAVETSFLACGHQVVVVSHEIFTIE